MTLIVHELEAVLDQSLTADRNVILEAVRLHLYRHNMPAGTLKVMIYDAILNLVATSETIEIADIGSAAFFHGYVRFNVNAGLKKDYQYHFQLVAEDYTFSESAYIGWCNDFDSRKYDTDQVVPHMEAPLDIELYERTAR